MSKPQSLSAHLLRTTCVLAVVLAVLVGLSVLVMPKDNTQEAGIQEVWAYGILSEPDNTIDVLFVGDSEAWSAFSPLKMWSEAGFTSYTCGTSSQRMCYGNALLHRATARQRPRVVLIETNELFRKFSLSQSILQELGNVLPVFEYHDRWKELTPADFTLQIAHTRVEPLRGFQLRFGVSAAADKNYMAEDEGEGDEMLEHIARLNRIYLGLMVDYCRQIGATPVLVSAPSPQNMSASRHRALAEVAKEYGIDYIDANEHVEEMGIDWDTDTFDRGDHLNFYGAQKLAVFLAAYLSDAYDLPDHRGEAAYVDWADSYEFYHSQYEEQGD